MYFWCNSKFRSRGWVRHPRTRYQEFCHANTNVSKVNAIASSTKFSSKRLFSFFSATTRQSRYLDIYAISIFWRWLDVNFFKLCSRRFGDKVNLQKTILYGLSALFSICLPFPPHTHTASQSSRISQIFYRDLVFRLRSILARMTFTRPCVWGIRDKPWSNHHRSLGTYYITSIPFSFWKTWIS